MLVTDKLFDLFPNNASFVCRLTQHGINLRDSVKFRIWSTTIQGIMVEQNQQNKQKESNAYELISGRRVSVCPKVIHLLAS